MLRFILVLLLAVFVLVPPAKAVDDKTARVMIVFDASGSMWAKIEGRTKIEIARQALAQAMGGIPENVEIGLMAYGHREKGNCTDIENLVSPAVGQGKAISEAVGRITPKGKTPLSEAVRQAAEALKYTEDKATVILITDGVETCNADPCALGTELEKLGIDFTAHVVGFGLNREEGQQVACLARNTGGKYLDANDADALGKAVSTTVAAAEKKEPEKPVELPAATLKVAGKPAIGASFAVEWTGPAAAVDYIDIVPVGYEKLHGELSYAYTRDGNPATLRAPGEPGSYEMRYVWENEGLKHVLATETIEVGDSETALVFPESAVAASRFEIEWKAPGQDTDYIDIVPKGFADTSGETSYTYVSEGNPLAIQAPGEPGDYEVRYVLEAPEGRKVLIRSPLKVTPVTASLSFQPDVKPGGEITVFWQGPGGDDYIDIVPRGFEETSGELDYFYVVDAPEAGELTAPEEPGKYDIRYILEAPEGRKVLMRVPLTIK